MSDPWEVVKESYAKERTKEDHRRGFATMRKALDKADPPSRRPLWLAIGTLILLVIVLIIAVVAGVKMYKKWKSTKAALEELRALARVTTAAI